MVGGACPRAIYLYARMSINLLASYLVNCYEHERARWPYQLRVSASRQVRYGLIRRIWVGAVSWDVRCSSILPQPASLPPITDVAVLYVLQAWAQVLDLSMYEHVYLHDTLGTVACSVCDVQSVSALPPISLVSGGDRSSCLGPRRANDSG